MSYSDQLIAEPWRFDMLGVLRRFEREHPHVAPPRVMERGRRNRRKAWGAFRRVFEGRLIVPGDPDYDVARAVWNGMVDRHPALVARCTGVADVVAALRFAREEGLDGDDLVAVLDVGSRSLFGYVDGILAAIARQMEQERDALPLADILVKAAATLLNQLLLLFHQVARAGRDEQPHRQHSQCEDVQLTDDRK